MEDTNIEKKEMPEEKIKENKDEKTQNNQPDPEIKTEKKIETEKEIPKTEKKETSEKNEKGKKDIPVKTEVQTKKETKKDVEPEKTKDKTTDKKDDFRYIVRIANTDIDGDKTLARGLTSIKGIGMHMSTLIIDKTGLNRNLKMGNLKDKEIEKIITALENVTETAPNWMLNHRKDLETGEDIHLIGSEIDMRLRDEINIMKKIRSYKGIRHERGLTVRGQRTRANNRRGLALGVSKKRQPSGK